VILSSSCVACEAQPPVCGALRSVDGLTEGMAAAALEHLSTKLYRWRRCRSPVLCTMQGAPNRSELPSAHNKSKIYRGRNSPTWTRRVSSRVVYTYARVRALAKVATVPYVLVECYVLTAFFTSSV